MLTKIKTLKNKTTNHVVRNRGKYGFAAGTGATLYVLAKMNETQADLVHTFLEDHNLTDAYDAFIAEA